MVIDYSFVNQFEKECWLLVINYCLQLIDYQRVKLLVKDFSLKNSLKQNCAIQYFEKLF